jgi:hypothetical protein
MSRRLEKLWQAFSFLFCCGVVLAFAHDLYTAFSKHSIYVYYKLARWFGLHEGWVSYDAHPIAFWSVVIFELLVLAASAIFVVLGVRSQRAMDYRLRRRNSSPVDNAARQTTSER